MSTARPNILFIFSDQHRWCDLGCYGNREVQTPCFDRFAAAGLRFDACFSESPLCVPARGTLLTGLSSRHHEAIGNDLPIRTDLTSVADVLSNADYHTGYIGKWHLAGVPRTKSIPQGRGRMGFQEWKTANCSHSYLDSYFDDEEDLRHPIPGYEPETQTSLAIDFIHRNADKNWALWLSWGPPHSPYREVPEEWLALYDPGALTLRPNVHLPVVENASAQISEESLRSALQGYYAHISALDREFGRLLDTLEKTGQLANTLVVYTSDHGDLLGSQGWMNKQMPYDEAVRVPLLIGQPGTIPSGVRSQLIGLSDLAPTILGAAGLAFPEKTDGRDFHALLHNGNTPTRSEIYLTDYTACHQSAFRGTPAWRAIRTEQYLLARFADQAPWLLFDMAADPFQQHNLFEEGTSLHWEPLSQRLDTLVEACDAWLDPEALISVLGLRAAWNESQKYFQLPEITPPGLPSSASP